MKSIGPFVVVRPVPPGVQPPVAVPTSWAVDRLTGMPVLLQPLAGGVLGPALPQHPALLPPRETVTVDGQTYLVSELPPHAAPVTNPYLAALGGLAGLQALHEHGLVHGHVDAAQLWQVDDQLLLAGAGLRPERGDLSPENDLRALAATLDALGGLPTVLTPLRDPPPGFTAAQALQRLDHPGLTQAAGQQADVPQQESAPLSVSAPVPLPGEEASLPTPNSGQPIMVAGLPLAVTLPPQAREFKRRSQPLASAGSTAQPPPTLVRNGTAPPASAASTPATDAPAPKAPGVREPPPPPSSGWRSMVRRLPAWVLPVAATLLLGLLTLVYLVGRGGPREPDRYPVKFTLQGTAHAVTTVKVTLVDAPDGVPWAKGTVLGQVPGTLHFPKPGLYRVELSARDFTPKNINVKVPTFETITIGLGR